MAEDVCPKTISGEHDWEDRYGYRECHYCSGRDQYFAEAKADIAELESQVDDLRQTRREMVAQAAALRARLAKREAWIQDAMVIFDKLAEAATACTCWPCCNGECLSNPWTDLRDLHEAAEGLRERAR